MLNVILNALCFTGTFLFMEVFSWIIHKYVMHGILWIIHKSHHLHGKSFFEWNDLFTLTFGGIAVWLMFSGLKDGDYRLWMGLGIALYGMVYFIVHDVMIHGRLKWIRKSNNYYVRAIIRAHKMHHRQLERDGSESFGLLWFSKKYFK